MGYTNWLTLSAMAAAALIGSTALQPSEASHFRGGNIAWTQGAGNTIDFTVTTYWRRDYWSNPAMNNGDVFTADVNFDFGDGTGTEPLTGTVFSVNAANNWLGQTATFTHTYADNTNRTAFLESCCRLGNPPHVNNPDESYRIETTIVGPGVGTDDSPNTGGSSPIFLVQDGGVQVFNPFTLSDPDGGSLTCSLASAAQGGGSFDQPVDLSINSATCDVTWDTDAAGADVNEMFSVSFLVTDDTGNTAPLDILLQACASTDPNCGGFQPPDVPEPGTLSILAVGLLSMAEAVRRRRRKN